MVLIAIVEHHYFVFKVFKSVIQIFNKYYSPYRWIKCEKDTLVPVSVRYVNLVEALSLSDLPMATVSEKTVEECK